MKNFNNEWYILSAKIDCECCLEIREIMFQVGYHGISTHLNSFKLKHAITHSGGICFESLGYPASCTPVLKSAHRIIHSTTLSKMSMYVAGFGGNVSPDPETLKYLGYPWISRISHRCRYWWWRYMWRYFPS